MIFSMSSALIRRQAAFLTLSFQSLAVIGYLFSNLGISAQINKSEGKYYALTFQKLVGLDFLSFLKPQRWLCEHFCDQRLPSYSLRQFQEVALRAFLWRLVADTRTFQTPNNYKALNMAWANENFGYTLNSEVTKIKHKFLVVPKTLIFCLLFKSFT